MLCYQLCGHYKLVVTGTWMQNKANEAEIHSLNLHLSDEKEPNLFSQAESARKAVAVAWPRPGDTWGHHHMVWVRFYCINVTYCSPLMLGRG